MTDESNALKWIKLILQVTDLAYPETPMAGMTERPAKSRSGSWGCWRSVPNLGWIGNR